MHEAETRGIEPRKVLPFDCFLDSLPPLAWNPGVRLRSARAGSFVLWKSGRTCNKDFAVREGFEPSTPEGVTE